MTTPAVPEEQQQPYFSIQRVFLKGSSLEMPVGSAVFLEQRALHMDLHIDIGIDKLIQGDFYEVTLRATLTGSVEAKTQFLLELQQAGIFEVRNLNAADLQAVLSINAPHILAPYLRAQITDTLARATLPMFLMPEVNWAGVYAQKQAEEAAALQGSPKLVH